jgi:F-type H+-transporting ATPase subunit c
MKKILSTIALFFAAAPAFAQTAAATGAGDYGLIAMGASLALGLAVIGGGLGQGKIGAAAMDGIARNPQAQGQILAPMIIALVFVETLILFTFVVAFLLAGKIPGLPA